MQIKSDKKTYQKIKNVLVSIKCKLSASGAAEVYLYLYLYSKLYYHIDKCMY